MIFLPTWAVGRDTYKDATARFLQDGAQPLRASRRSDGGTMRTVRAVCMFMNAPMRSALIDFAAEWSDLLEIDTRPVVEDAQAGAAMAKVAVARK